MLSIQKREQAHDGYPTLYQGIFTPVNSPVITKSYHMNCYDLYIADIKLHLTWVKILTNLS